MSFNVLDLGRIDYRKALKIQQDLVSDIYVSKAKDTLILCEHDPVITLGRSADIKNILRPDDELKALGFEVYNVDRGGDVTMHIPGQLVVYPVFNLMSIGCRLSGFLRALEEVVISVLGDYGIHGKRKEGLSGVWLGDEKISSIGICVRHWISSHGLSLNVNCNLDLFSLIRPCGQDIMMTSISKQLNKQEADLDTVKEKVIGKFNLLF